MIESGSEIVSFSSGYSRTLLHGLTDFGLVEQQGRFLLSAADKFFLTARFRVSSDFCGARKRSSSNGMAGSLPLLPGSKSLACSLSLSDKIRTLHIGDTWPLTGTEVTYRLDQDVQLKAGNQPFLRCCRFTRLRARQN